MRTLIIDDEILARSRIKSLLLNKHEIELAGECSSGRDAVKKINDIKPQLIFLDINMKDMNGFEVLEQITISPKPVIIFVTAYDNYASQAFDVEAFDFLLKPFKDERFYRTLKKVLQTPQKEADQIFKQRFADLMEHYTRENKVRTPAARIPIKLGNKTYLLPPLNINYIIASGYYAEIYTAEKKLVIRESLNNLENILDNNNFIRIHRSTIININQIKEIVHSGFSEIDARMNDDKLLRVSKSNKKQFLKLIGLSHEE